jgi:hypothetical protein
MTLTGKWIVYQNEYLVSLIDVDTEDEFTTWSGSLGQTNTGAHFQQLADDDQPSFAEALADPNDYLWNVNSGDPTASGFYIKRDVDHVVSGTVGGVAPPVEVIAPGESIIYSYTVSGTMLPDLVENPDGFVSISREMNTTVTGTRSRKGSTFFNPDPTATISGGAIVLASGTEATISFDIPGTYNIGPSDGAFLWRNEITSVVVSGSDKPNFGPPELQVGTWKMSSPSADNYTIVRSTAIDITSNDGLLGFDKEDGSLLLFTGGIISASSPTGSGVTTITESGIISPAVNTGSSLGDNLQTITSQGNRSPIIISTSGTLSDIEITAFGINSDVVIGSFGDGPGIELTSTGSSARIEILSEGTGGGAITSLRSKGAGGSTTISNEDGTGVLIEGNNSGVSISALGGNDGGISFNTIDASHTGNTVSFSLEPDRSPSVPAWRVFGEEGATAKFLIPLNTDAGLTSSGVPVFSSKNFLESYSGHIEQPGSGTEAYTLEQSAPFTMDIEEYTVKLSGGTALSSITIDDVPITGLSHESLSVSEGAHTASALNSVSIGQTIKLTASGADVAQDLTFSLTAQRTA